MSFRMAINQKCIECIYDPIGGPGSWRSQVEACTSMACPLFPVRPLTIKSIKRRGNVDSCVEIAPLGANHKPVSQEGQI